MVRKCPLPTHCTYVQQANSKALYNAIYKIFNILQPKLSFNIKEKRKKAKTTINILTYLCVRLAETETVYRQLLY